MSERFYSTRPITSDHATLDGPEAHHLLHVMRASVGEEVTLFDGSGAEFSAQITKLGRSAIDLHIIERQEANRELPITLTVGVALPKGDRQKWLVEKLTELGVTKLVPLTTERCVAQPTAGALERLERSVIEAAKQCGRNRLMHIAPPQVWKEWLKSNEALRSQPTPAGDSPAILRLVAHPQGPPIGSVQVLQPQPVQLAIGPEGGLTDAEIAAAIAAGWQTVSLGPRILRVETAAIALAAAIVLETTNRIRGD